MTNPSDWRTLTKALRELHRALVERARTDYLRENLIGGDIGPSELLRLLTTDPYFEWLRGLSELIVDIDLAEERSKKKPQELADITALVRGAVEYFITPPSGSESASAFAQQYWPYVQDSPHVAMAHADVKRALGTWPAAQAVGREALLQERKALGVRAREEP